MTSILKIKRSRPFLGTFIEIEISYKQLGEEDNINLVLNNAYNNIAKLENIFSIYNPLSFVFKLNTDSVLLNPPYQLYELLKISYYISKITGGLFDITAESALLVSYNDISISQSKIEFLKKGIKINFGGIAKGYIVDKTVEFLLQYNLYNIIVNAGGDIRTYGNKTTPINLRSPFEHAKYIDIGNFTNCAIASSSITKVSQDRGGKSKVFIPKKLAKKLNIFRLFCNFVANYLPNTQSNKIVHATVVCKTKKFSCTIADALTKPALLGFNVSKFRNIKCIAFNGNGLKIIDIK